VIDSRIAAIKLAMARVSSPASNVPVRSFMIRQITGAEKADLRCSPMSRGLQHCRRRQAERH
jgi:hypothetical protein